MSKENSPTGVPNPTICVSQSYLFLVALSVNLGTINVLEGTVCGQIWYHTRDVRVWLRFGNANGSGSDPRSMPSAALPRIIARWATVAIEQL